MCVVVVCKFSMISSADVTACMEMIDSLLRPVNTIFSREFFLAFQSCEWLGKIFRIRGASDTAKDHVMRPLSTGVIALSLAALWYMLGLENAIPLFSTAHGVNSVPSSRRMRIFRMDVHGPVFVRRTHCWLMEGDIVLCWTSSSVYTLKRINKSTFKLQLKLTQGWFIEITLENIRYIDSEVI